MKMMRYAMYYFIVLSLLEGFSPVSPCSSSSSYTHIENQDYNDSQVAQQCPYQPINISVSPFTFQSSIPQTCSIQVVPIQTVRLTIYAVTKLEVYSYSYVETRDCYNCKTKYHVIYNTEDCTAQFDQDPTREGIFSIRFIDINQTIEILHLNDTLADDDAHYSPQESEQEVVSQLTGGRGFCNVTEYDAVVEGRTLRFVGESHDLDKYEMDCYLRCQCILRYHEWVMECGPGIFRHLILYNRNVQNIRYDMGLDVIAQDAFKGFQSILSLELQDNAIKEISTKSFQDCKRLVYLYLY